MISPITHASHHSLRRTLRCRRPRGCAVGAAADGVYGASAHLSSATLFAREASACAQGAAERPPAGTAPGSSALATRSRSMRRRAAAREPAAAMATTPLVARCDTLNGPAPTRSGRSVSRACPWRRQCGAELLLLGAPPLVHSAQLTLPLPPPPTRFVTAPSIESCGVRAACSLHVLVVVGAGRLLLSARARSRWAPTAAAH